MAKLAGNRGQRRSLAELADDDETSASTFQRAFSRLVGESPKQYTRRLQLEYAALALISTLDPILDVALDAGFESHEGFTRAFSGHFGATPKEFRRRHAHLADRRRHVALLEHIGPCVGIFRAPDSSTTPTKDRTMNYDITRQPIDSINFLYKKGRCTHADIADTLGKLLPAVFQYAMQSGFELRSRPTAIYQEWGPGMVTIHAGMAVETGTPSDGIELATLPACDAAVTTHAGAYDGLGDAHAALEQFIDEQGLHSEGPPREIYLTDPGEVPDPKDWKTQIVWPVGE